MTKWNSCLSCYFSLNIDSCNKNLSSSIKTHAHGTHLPTKFATTSRFSTTSSMAQRGFCTVHGFTYVPTHLCIPNQISPSHPSAKNLHFLTKNPKWCTALLHLGKRNNEIYIHVYSYLAKMRERGRDCVHLTQGWGNPLLFSPSPLFILLILFQLWNKDFFLLKLNSGHHASRQKVSKSIQKMHINN